MTWATAGKMELDGFNSDAKVKASLHAWPARR
jgi:hypothetical protein